MMNYKTLNTPYSEQMDKAQPWNVYPRPQLVRNSYFSLCGEWDFSVSGNDDFKEKILVPFPPESALSGIERRMPKNCEIIYRRFFTLPEGFVNDRVILHVGAADQICTVFINEKKAAYHEGGYMPFSADITDFLIDGENEIKLFVKDTLSKKFPYGKQKNKRGGMWYTPVSGIWQPVWIESTPKNPIHSLKIEQNVKNARITVYSEAEYKKLTLKADGTVYEFSGDTVTVEPKEPKLWSPEEPYLYEFILETETDRVESYFALRSLEVKAVDGTERLCLNGKPYLFNGLLDQGYFPDGIFLPATEKGYEDDILFAKSLGFNTLRKHIKVEPLIFYHLCDKLGIIVFQDMVNNGKYSFLLDTALPTVGFKKAHATLRHKNPEQRERFYDNMAGTANLLYNSPSVCLYTIFNEGWGQFLADEAYVKLKEIDSSRFIDSTSGWFHARLSDVDSEHIYFRSPTFKKNYKRPVHLSEFGGYSLRIDGHLYGEKNYGYRLYRDRESFSDAVFDLYTNGAAKLIGDGLCALIYTQLSDVEDETNGLITYDRRVIKINEEKMREANAALYAAFDEATKEK